MDTQPCPCRAKYSTKYTAKKLFSRPYFSHPFEVIPIEGTDVVDRTYVLIESDKDKNRISGKYFNHS